MKKIIILLSVVLLCSACNSKKDGYDPYKISGKKEHVDKSKTSFEVSFKKTDSNVKTIHVKLNSNGYDAIFDTGCSGMSISSLELADLFKSNTISKDDYVGDAIMTIADGTQITNPIYNIKNVTIVDTDGREHTLTDIQATVVDNMAANILVGSSVIDNLAKKSYTASNPQLTWTRAISAGSGLFSHT